MDFSYPGDEQIVVKDAEILGFGSSKGDTKDRWTELTIVGTETGYFVAGVGRSRLPGETDRHWCSAYPEASKLVTGLLRPDGRGGKFMPNYGRDALESAADLDEDVNDAFRELCSSFSWGN